MEGARVSLPDAGTWGIQRGRSLDLLVCGPHRWTLCRGRGVYDARRRALVYLGLEEALALLLEWGFGEDTFWQADNFWRHRRLSVLRMPPRVHTPARAGSLLPPRRALAPYNLGG